ncbi:unnamed protein product [Durusdinium trenchii]|uniref:NAD(P)-binding domain-containing protein n=2 Tax=Durusdinium trenchii TaxID=1381693 RepID=A0ABP0RR94_9DINO
MPAPVRNSKDGEFVPRRILLTGGAGFIGSNVLIHLVHKYPEVRFVCLDNLSEGSNLANLRSVTGARNFAFLEGDVLCPKTVRETIISHELDTVMHFAAQTHVDRSFVMPVKFSEVNVLGTAVLLQACLELGVRRFLYVSTDEVYGENVGSHRFSETDPFRPGNPYSASKAAAECLVRGYMESFGRDLPIVVVRPNNIYGPRQYPEKLIPKFIYRLQRKQELPLHGGGRARRSFLFVEDAAEAFDLVLRKGRPGEAYNIGAGAGSTKSVLEVARALMEHFGIDAKQADQHMQVVADRVKNDASYDVHDAKIRNLGWKPLVTFEDGLRRTVEWYRQNPGHWTSVDDALLPDNSGRLQKAAL